MSRPAIQTIKLSDSVSLSECHRTANYPRGWWLYDKTRGMNLSIAADSKETALLDALHYYQRRLKEIETSYETLNIHVNRFVRQVTDAEE